jgi:hypothetical protein
VLKGLQQEYPVVPEKSFKKLSIASLTVTRKVNVVEKKKKESLAMQLTVILKNR